MFIIDITLDLEKVPEEQREEIFAAHSAWYTKYYESGDFMVVGPYKDRIAGVVIAKADSKEEIEKIIAEDSFYPDRATYEISEFTAHLIADNITDYKGK